MSSMDLTLTQVASYKSLLCGIRLLLGTRTRDKTYIVHLTCTQAPLEDWKNPSISECGPGLETSIQAQILD